MSFFSPHTLPMAPLGAIVVLLFSLSACWCGNDGPPRPPKASASAINTIDGAQQSP